jgi:hypothetical protein
MRIYPSVWPSRKPRAWIISGTQEECESVYVWLNELKQTRSTMTFSHRKIKDTYKVFVRFDDEADAIALKLRWDHNT